jgi:hypothetical protein
LRTRVYDRVERFSRATAKTLNDLFVIPGLELVVAFTGHNYENVDGISNLYTMLRFHIMAAIDQASAAAPWIQLEPVRPAGIFRGIVNADAWPGADTRLVYAQSMILNPDRAIQQAAAGERCRDTQRLRNRTRACQQRAVGL